MNFINDKINHLALKFFAGNNSKFASLMGTSETNIRNYRKNTLPKIEFVINLHKKLNISYDWLFSDFYEQKEELLIIRTDNEAYAKVRRIPLYDAMYDTIEEQPEISEEKLIKPVAHIDPGCWFPEATAAIRHYGHDITEYPHGCVLVLKKTTVENITFGVNYVIATKEGFHTLCLYPGDDKEHILGCPTEKKNHSNKDDQDFSVLPIADILHLFTILGCVIK